MRIAIDVPDLGSPDTTTTGRPRRRRRRNDTGHIVPDSAASGFCARRLIPDAPASLDR
jgi:hypothetical protein